MNQLYLIPANSKKSLLIFGLFNPFDLILVSAGVSITLLLLLILPIENLGIALIALSPGLLSALLVMPVPNYHNVLTVIKIVLSYFTSRQRFVWKGWGHEYGEQEKEQIYKR